MLAGSVQLVVSDGDGRAWHLRHCDPGRETACRRLTIFARRFSIGPVTEMTAEIWLSS
jgi:hypothetical protein